jgi:dienelactone hydrolase
MPGAARLVVLLLSAVATGMQAGIVFDDYPEFAHASELLRRSLGPVAMWSAERQMARAGQVIREQPVDLARERFTLYVPAEAPPGGYALMVFIFPSAAAKVPDRWPSALDHHGMIFVGAENAGNDAAPFDRREPLALAAARNVMKRYPVDPARVYVGGFSGGSRVALRLAVAYPDLFSGALLDAGSDALGEAIVIPPADLFHRFQESSRLVYLTGDHDDFHRNLDNRSRDSMRAFCVSNFDIETMHGTWHQLADPASFSQALDSLLKPAAVDRSRLADCRAGVVREVAQALGEVKTLIASGKSTDARALLDKLDVRYGGLAAPESLELAKRVEAAP